MTVAMAVGGCSTTGDSAPSASPEPTTTAASVTPSSSTPLTPMTLTPTTPTLPPPYVDHVDWVQTSLGPSLQIHPTPSGRRTENPQGAQIAWTEVLRLAPDADTPGMRAQFDCHWDFARAVEPDKPSWNIEPWRPVVTDDVMIATRCNPGGPEE
ncbi:DUF2599 domain-containing protein [Gordonia rhizosphera]|nr:DUF2599 domain-containing protein [Gordonia rhizosphera]